MSNLQPDQARLPKLPELWILRHGETEWNRAGRLQGHLDSPLTETGKSQARTQGDILKRCALPRDTVLVSSPSGRARLTAEIANKELGLPVKTEAAFTEIDMGNWQGETVGALARTIPDLPVLEDPHLWKFTAPEGETLEDMSVRVERGLRRLKGPTVIVTHGVTSRLMRCFALGLAPAALSSLPGGQGIVHHIRDGKAVVLGPEAR
ncbi:MAG: histidine phosphatase family protein [Pseudomonadota bacterium]